LQPPAPAPTPDSFWVPPCDYWDQGQFVRRPGYWLTAQPGWVWIPSHYVWTPRGYVFIRGHWDYSLERRGLLFAPVYFPRSVYIRPGFIYSPSVVVDFRILEGCLFAYPGYCHYYFGDYYDDAYLRLGIYPWFECVRRHTWYDPIYEYERWHHHQTEPRWEEDQRHDYDLRRSDRGLRPPRTYRDMETRLAKLPESQRKDLRLAQPLTTAISNKATLLKFGRTDTEEARQKIAKQVAEVHKARQERDRRESTPAGAKVGQPTAQATATAPPGSKKPETPPPRLKEALREQQGAAVPEKQQQEAATERAKQDQEKQQRQAAAEQAKQDQEKQQRQAAAERAKQEQEKQQREAAAERARQEQRAREQQAREQQDAADRQNQQREAAAQRARQEQQAHERNSQPQRSPESSSDDRKSRP
jgi:hypothetical protein